MILLCVPKVLFSNSELETIDCTFCRYDTMTTEVTHWRQKVWSIVSCSAHLPVHDSLSFDLMLPTRAGHLRLLLLDRLASIKKNPQVPSSSFSEISVSYERLANHRLPFFCDSKISKWRSFLYFRLFLIKIATDPFGHHPDDSFEGVKAGVGRYPFSEKWTFRCDDSVVLVTVNHQKFVRTRSSCQLQLWQNWCNLKISTHIVLLCVKWYKELNWIELLYASFTLRVSRSRRKWPADLLPLLYWEGKMSQWSFKKLNSHMIWV